MNSKTRRKIEAALGVLNAALRAAAADGYVVSVGSQHGDTIPTQAIVVSHYNRKTDVYERVELR